MSDFHYAILIEALTGIREQMKSIKGAKRTSEVSKNGVVFNSIKTSGQNITGACVCNSNFGIITLKTLNKLWGSERRIVTDIKNRKWDVLKINSNEYMAFTNDEKSSSRGNGKMYLVKYFNHNK